MAQRAFERHRWLLLFCFRNFFAKWIENYADFRSAMTDARRPYWKRSMEAKEHSTPFFFRSFAKIRILGGISGLPVESTQRKRTKRSIELHLVLAQNLDSRLSKRRDYSAETRKHTLSRVWFRILAPNGESVAERAIFTCDPVHLYSRRISRRWYLAGLRVLSLAGILAAQDQSGNGTQGTHARRLTRCWRLGARVLIDGFRAYGVML